MSKTNGRQERTPEVSTGTGYRFPASQKVYLRGEIHPDVRVPMREIALSPTHGHNGSSPDQNPPLRVYDASGPYTDPDARIDVHEGLSRLREPWIRNRPGVFYAE